MKRFIKLTLQFIIVLQCKAACLAQISSERIDLGIRAGGLLAGGYASIPVQYSFISNNQLQGQSNGHTVGYIVGLFTQLKTKDQRNYLQVDVLAISTPLKQRTTIPVSVDKAVTSLLGIPAVLVPNGASTTVDAASEPSLKAIEVPILLGRYFFNNRFRISAGPSLLFYYQADLIRNVSGQMSLDLANLKFSIPVNNALVQQLKLDEVFDLKPKPISWGINAEVGAAIRPFLDVNVRYGVPVGGIFQKSGITGYLGMVSVAVNCRF
ncbi:hypothetical protein GCM10028808_59020 [Spirosoma migulaei]